MVDFVVEMVKLSGQGFACLMVVYCVTWSLLKWKG